MNILCIVHPSHSHIHASLQLIRILHNDGHTISVCSIQEVYHQYEDSGYKFYGINFMPFASGFESIIARKWPGPRYLNDLIMRFSGFLYNNRLNKLLDVLQIVKPEVIIIDILYATDVLLISNWEGCQDCKILYFCTKPSLGNNCTTPPVNSNVIPSSNTQILKTWKWFQLKKKFKNIGSAIYFLGCQDYRVLRDYIKKSAQKTFLNKHPLSWNDFVGLKFNHIPELVLLPQAFEFETFRPNPYQNYIGFQFSHREEQFGTPNYDAVKTLIARKNKEGRLLVYCSFGTIYDLHGLRIKKFLKKAIEAIKNLENIYMIVSLKDELRQKFHFQSDSQVFFFDFVPQLSVLKHSEAFITHGGINSIKEAIHYGVPLLVYPLNLNWDQPGNGARVVYHKIGLRGDMNKVTSGELKEQLTQLIGSSTYRRNLKRLKEIDLTYTADYVLEKFYQAIGTEVSTVKG